jgi:hypothetical protein
MWSQKCADCSPGPFRLQAVTRKGELQRGRPPDDELDKYFEYANNFFIYARSNFPQLEEFFYLLNQTL